MSDKLKFVAALDFIQVSENSKIDKLKFVGHQYGRTQRSGI